MGIGRPYNTHIGLYFIPFINIDNSLLIFVFFILDFYFVCGKFVFVATVVKYVGYLYDICGCCLVFHVFV